MERYELKISFDPVTPVYLHFPDRELAEFLNYEPVHPQAMQALTAIVIATTCSLYSGYSLVWQLSPRNALSRALKLLYASGHLSLYTLFDDIDNFRKSRINFFAHAKDNYSFYFRGDGDKIAKMFDDPILKRIPTTPIIEGSLRAWSQEQLQKDEDDRIGNILKSTLNNRKTEAITISLFTQKMNISKNDKDIREINRAIEQVYISVYLRELNGAIMTGLKKCAWLDDISDYCPHYDFSILSYAISAVFGKNVLQNPVEYLDASVGLRRSKEQVYFCESLNSLLFELTQIEQNRSDLRVVSIEQLRRRLVGGLSVYLPYTNENIKEFTEQTFANATARILEAKEHFMTKSPFRQLQQFPIIFDVQHSLRPIGTIRESQLSLKGKSTRKEERFDIAILTVIGPELEAIQKALHCNNIEDRILHHGSLYWNASIFSQISRQNLSIIVHCIGSPGHADAATATAQIIERYSPQAIFLMGIAAGRRGKCKIGDVIIPRAVVDHTTKVAEGGELKERPFIPSLPYTMIQMLRAFRLDRKEWYQRFQELFTKQVLAPSGKAEIYSQHVATLPEIHESAIASADILLRDSVILERLADNIHQQIRIGEMEAGGFVKACQNRTPPVPWLIVRGVSDFGDELKDDLFHELASCTAASYLICFLTNGFDLELLKDSSLS